MTDRPAYETTIRTYSNVRKMVAALVFLAGSVVSEGLSSALGQETTTTVETTVDPSTTETAGEAESEKDWRTLSEGWVASQFGGEGDVTIKDGEIMMEYGDPLTGVRWQGPFDGDTKKPKDEKAAKLPPLPRDNYEIRWECRRDKGYDFMCAFTFPVAKQYASLVMGGWGGGITGISSIDGRDASDNDTTMFKAFENDQWYKARVRVETEKVTVWVDGVELFDHPRASHEFDIRFEMDPCTPLGIANFECNSTIRNIQIRVLEPADSVKAESDK